MFNAKQFCSDYEINIPDLSQNTQEGWVNIQCPFCDDDTNHGGINTAGGYFYCWKCGWHSLFDLIAELTELRSYEVSQILNTYDRPEIIKKRKKSYAKNIELPLETIELQKQHKMYLQNRNFDYTQLQKTWNIKGTLNTGPYSYRIIAPIYYKNKLVSYQARDITDKASIKYKACKIKKEIIHHKHMCYGIDKIENKKGIIVEGITDVWRIGSGAICTFGTSYTPQQVQFIKNHLDTIFILYDFREKQAKEKATKLCCDLSLFCSVEIIELDVEGDPGNMSQKDADYLKKTLLK